MGLLGDGAQAEGDEVGDERVGVDVVRDGRERADERLAQRADQGGGGELDVLGRAARRRRRPRAGRREAGGVGAAEGQALGLDGRIDGLGEQRPGQAPAAQRAAREGLDRGGEPLGGRGRRPPRRPRAWRRPRAATRAGRPRRRARPWTGSGGTRCRSPRRRRPRPRPPAPRGSRRGRSARAAARDDRARGWRRGGPRCARSGGRAREEVNHSSAASRQLGARHARLEPRRSLACAASPPGDTNGQDQSEEPGRRARRRRDDPDHLAVHQGPADPARTSTSSSSTTTSASRTATPPTTRSRSTPPTPSSSTASASSARRSRPTRRASRSSASRRCSARPTARSATSSAA